MNAIFTNRRDAGRKLAQQLLKYANQSKAIVLGLPRRGLPVAYEVAKKLNLPLDVCLVKKLGLPGNPELAMGAVAENSLIPDYDGQITIIVREQAQISKLNREEVHTIAAKEKAELRWRESCYRHSRPMLTIANRIIIVVDDGIATGLSMHAAIEALSLHHPAEMIIATPVASYQAISRLERQVDNFICLAKLKSLGAVGFWYEDFSQTTDREVCDLLDRQNCQHFVEYC